MPINATTRFCAVLGQPIKHSASPAMHNAAFAALGLNWCYGAFEVHPDHLRAAIEGAKALRYAGLNLTVPHKMLAVGMMDVLDPAAEVWGAVNTVRFEGRGGSGNWLPLHQFGEAQPESVRSCGFNTDAEAIIRAASEDLAMDWRGARVLLLGAGGAGRVAALKLSEQPIAELFLVNRTGSKAAGLADEIRRRNPGLKVELGYPSGDVDLLMNATSLGLNEADGLPLDEGRFPVRQARAVFDMIYRPALTPLLQAAQAAGCRTANGLGMLLYQGAAAFELWTGQIAPVAVMRAALEANIYGL